MYTIGVTRPGDLEAGSTFRVLKLWSPFLSFVSGEVAGQGPERDTYGGLNEKCPLWSQAREYLVPRWCHWGGLGGTVLMEEGCGWRWASRMQRLLYFQFTPASQLSGGCELLAPCSSR